MYYNVYLLLICYPFTPHRMFSSSLANHLPLKPNENGEYEVAKGLSASIFRAVLVSGSVLYCQTGAANGTRCSECVPLACTYSVLSHTCSGVYVPMV